MLKSASDRLSCRAASRAVGPRPLHLAGACWLLSLLAALAWATPKDEWRYRAGLRNSPSKQHQFGAKDLDRVLASLREKSGFAEMSFDEAGFLTLGDRTRIVGGSAAARALLVAVVDGDKAFDLEAHTGSRRLIFARVAPSIIYESRASGRRIEVQPLELDFYDFTRLRGDKDVIAAFDVGFAILHELGHGALDLRDAAANTAELGECEGYINRIRRELDLPERRHYYARRQPRPVLSGIPSAPRVELVFARSIEKEGRVRVEEVALSWTPKDVGEAVTTGRTSNPPRERASVAAL